MNEWRRMFRGEWVFAIVAIGLVAVLLWEGFNIFDAVNSVVVGIFWFAVIIGSFVGMVYVLRRRRNE